MRDAATLPRSHPAGRAAARLDDCLLDGGPDLSFTPSRIWDGDRLRLRYVASSPSEEEPVGVLRLGFEPRTAVVWIGWIELTPEWRGRGIARAWIERVETAAEGIGAQRIRLFARQGSEGFWLHLGYRPEHDPRFFHKVPRGAPVNRRGNG